MQMLIIDNCPNFAYLKHELLITKKKSEWVLHFSVGEEAEHEIFGYCDCFRSWLIG